MENFSGLTDMIPEKTLSFDGVRLVRKAEDGRLYLIIPLPSEKIIGDIAPSGTLYVPKPSDVSAAETIVSELLRRIGVPASIRGYYYLRAAVIYTAFHYEYAKNAKAVYAHISAEYKMSIPKIERAMRYALTVAFDRGDKAELDAVFGKSRPANLAAVAGLAGETMRLMRG